ncbi:MAG: hypothetical protein IT371_14530 [Deltaproteobacteria bacterium]|nr:hypothetical protein [Deltaproteobacteria bacterium]
MGLVLTLRLVTSLALVLATVFLVVMARRERASVAAAVLVPLFALLALWIPPGWRRWVLGAVVLTLWLFALAGIWSSEGSRASKVGIVAAVALVLGGSTYLVERYLPGGALAVSLGIVSLVGLVRTVGATRALRTLEGAAPLEASSELGSAVFELEGRLQLRHALLRPALEPEPSGRDAEPVAPPRVAFWELLDGSGDRVCYQGAPFLIVGADVQAVVDPRAVRLDLTKRAALPVEQARAALAAPAPEGVEREVRNPAASEEYDDRTPAQPRPPAPPDEPPTPEEGWTLQWLEETATAYVRGRPVWQGDPAGLAGDYRGSPRLPAFAGAETLLADRPEHALAREATYRLWLWGVLTPLLVLTTALVAAS